MQVNLIEVTTKPKKIKIILFFILIVLIIVVFSMLGIYAAKMYHTEYTKKQNQRNEEKAMAKIEEDSKVDENSVFQNTAEIQKGDVHHQIPVYSENAKNNMKNIYQSDKKIAYLTFDDGPSRAVTPLILDLLKQENIKATFFVLGKSVDTNPDLLKREYEEGHYIANHGYTHSYSKIYTSEQTVLEEYRKTETSIKKALNNESYASYLFRFPGGSNGGKYHKIKSKAKRFLNENNISYIDWNALTCDAEGIPTKESIMKNLIETTKDKNSVVILMHDASTKILTYETLPNVIQYLREQGYEFDNFYSIMK